MNPLLRIVGTEIWIGSHLFSSGLEGLAYGNALRQAEELIKVIEAREEAAKESAEATAYNRGYEDGERSVELWAK